MERLPLDLRENHKVFVLDVHDPKVRAAIQNPKWKIRGFLKLFLDGRNLKPNKDLLYRCVCFFKNWRGDKEELALAIWDYLQSVNPRISDDLLKKVAQKAIEDGIFPEGGSMNIRDLIRHKGWQEGRKEGRQEGRQEGRKRRNL